MESSMLRSAFSRLPAGTYLTNATPIGPTIQQPILRSYAALKDNGYRVEGGEVRDSFGWSSWRNRRHVWLEFMFPLNAARLNQP